MTGIYTAELYRQANGREAWRILNPAGQPVQDGIERDHDLEAILAEWNASVHRTDGEPA